MLIDGASKEITVADPARLAGVMDLDAPQGSIATLGGPKLAVAKSVADDKGWQLGSTVPVRFADGASDSFTVGAIFDAQGTAVGDYLVPRAEWTPHSGRDADGTVLVKLRQGTSLAAGRAAVERVTPAYGDPKVQDRDQYADTVSSGVSGFLTVVYVLLALAILIALMGIANTMSLSIHERTRELGLLRAVGQTRRQARVMVRWESVIVALFGTAGGLGLGVFLGWALVRAISPAGIGAFAAPPPRLALILLVGVLAGVLAGVRPARRAARLNLLTAIATE